MRSYVLAAVGSATAAARLVRRCEKEGIHASTVHTPAAMNRGGCSYSVRVSESDSERLLSLAAERGINVRRVILEKSDEKGAKNYYDIS